MLQRHQADENVNVRPAAAADLTMVKALAKKFSNEIGFVPAAALEWYVENGCVLIVTENDDAAGYVLGRPSMRFNRDVRGITQTAVFMDAQRRHLGLSLVDTYCLTSRLAGRSCVQAWCAADIDAMAFWPRAGFTAVAERQPENARGRRLVLWRRSLTAVPIPDFHKPPPVAGFRAARTTAVRALSGLTAVLDAAAVAEEERITSEAENGRSYVVSADNVTTVPPLDAPADGRLFDPTDRTRPFRT